MADSGDGAYETLHQTTRRAARARRCGECHREIAPGERYEHYAGVADEIVGVHVTCAHCVAAREWLLEVCSGFAFGGVLEDLAEHLEDYRGVWLARAVWGMERGWRRRDGTPLPVPRPPNPASLRPTWQRRRAAGAAA